MSATGNADVQQDEPLRCEHTEWCKVTRLHNADLRQRLDVLVCRVDVLALALRMSFGWDAATVYRVHSFGACIQFQGGIS
jgi:hypothetical protein